MDMIENRIENMANEVPSPKRLIKHDIPPEILKTAKSIFNFIVGSYLKISLIILIFSLVFQQWIVIISLIANIVVIYIIKKLGKWFIQNYKNIQVTTIKERVGDSPAVYELKIDKIDNEGTKDTF